ncbi:hypothetical protein [Dethiothermospora halolimnae]|uniref:hypothetical protein n=1 Tax=Dethiothermospora halolimnae TaxID=3114390 RepID=UPI003CCC3876
MARKIVPISVKDEGLIKYLESKENKSRYIRELIKKDMNKELDQYTKDLILDFIKNNFKDIGTSKNTNLSRFKNEIDSIFDT